ncbi:MAG: hypothetical protein DMF63_04405 [Acidobacteria bacterium]|nr:MAG: hypothetical protein DMF63_04405 [Acidobacteriota bacterium]
MTNWYDPRQLIDTAKRTVISTTVGQYADPRSGMPDPKPGEFFDYSKHVIPGKIDFEVDKSKDDRKEIWIDYAADVGDGFNPTYAVAYYLSQPELQLADVERPLPRGEILFFGGDGVYPTANAKRYEDQLVTPYRMAFKAGVAKGQSPVASELAQCPDIFALPGNHDWYDSLVAFKLLFCSHVFNARRFAADEKGNGGWATRQKRSYFTFKLPQNWWLLAVDLQLSHDIDVAQLEYFESVIRNMGKDDKVILCVPEPYWEKAIKYGEVTDKYAEKEKSIKKLEGYFKDREVQVRAFIAGDLHHYRRFEDDEGVQKITAGGGGAFLHPTHDFDFEEAQTKSGHSVFFRGFSMRGEYPKYAASKKLEWRNFGFLFYNWTFGILTAGIYFVLALLVHGKIQDDKLRWTNDKFWSKATTMTIDRMIEEPLVILIVILLLLGLIFFTDSESKRYKRWAGFLHGTAHLIATFIFGWLAYALSLWINDRATATEGSTLSNVIWFSTVLVVCGIGGYIVGSFIMGVYLYISLHFFGRHSNEAFSALKIEDYKNFLRMHIDTNGILTIYPIKIETVPKDWKDDGEYFTPVDGTKPKLIEDRPIVVS